MATILRSTVSCLAYIPTLLGRGGADDEDCGLAFFPWLTFLGLAAMLSVGAVCFTQTQLLDATHRVGPCSVLSPCFPSPFDCRLGLLGFTAPCWVPSWNVSLVEDEDEERDEDEEKGEDAYTGALRHSRTVRRNGSFASRNRTIVWRNQTAGCKRGSNMDEGRIDACACGLYRHLHPEGQKTQCYYAKKDSTGGDDGRLFGFAPIPWNRWYPWGGLMIAGAFLTPLCCLCLLAAMFEGRHGGSKRAARRRREGHGGGEERAHVTWVRTSAVPAHSVTVAAARSAAIYTRALREAAAVAITRRAREGIAGLSDAELALRHNLYRGWHTFLVGCARSTSSRPLLRKFKDTRRALKLTCSFLGPRYIGRFIGGPPGLAKLSRANLAEQTRVPRSRPRGESRRRGGGGTGALGRSVRLPGVLEQSGLTSDAAIGGGAEPPATMPSPESVSTTGLLPKVLYGELGMASLLLEY